MESVSQLTVIYNVVLLCLYRVQPSIGTKPLLCVLSMLNTTIIKAGC